MADKDDKSIDTLGLEPVSCAVEKVTGGVVDAAKAFLSPVGWGKVRTPAL